MTELVHSQLEPYLAKQAGSSHSYVYLVHGQEMLVEQSIELLLKHLLGSADRDTCCQVVPGLAENIPDVLEQLNTFALLAGPKIILFKDAKLFDTGGAQQRLIAQIVDARDSGNHEQAARGFLQLCGRLGLDLETARQGGRSNSALKQLVDAVGSSVVQQMIDYCLDRQWKQVATQDAVGSLLQAVKKGFPDNHFLIVAVNAKVPKNLKFYKTMAACGLIVDCNVPMGDRRADKIAQDAVLRETLQQQLADSGKRLAPGLFESLTRLTGFDLRTFSRNVEKLIDYCGEQVEITAEDIDHLLRRTKNDPIFELTNAVADRNTVQALFYLNALLKAKWHPLQILSALANQIRKLLVAKDFAKGVGRKEWSAGISYQQFQSRVMPVIQASDADVRERSQRWRPEDADSPKGKKGAGKRAVDVALAPNPKNAYPVYQTILKSEKYAEQELVTALVLIGQSDLRLKSTGQDPAMVIKKTITEICNGSQ